MSQPNIQAELAEQFEEELNRYKKELLERIEAETKLREYPDWKKTDFEIGYNQAIFDIKQLL